MQPVRQRAFFDQDVSGVGIHATQHKGKRPGFTGLALPAISPRNVVDRLLPPTVSAPPAPRSTSPGRTDGDLLIVPDLVARRAHRGVADFTAALEFPFAEQGKIVSIEFDIAQELELLAEPQCPEINSRAKSNTRPERVRLCADLGGKVIRQRQWVSTDIIIVALDNDPPEGGVAAEGVYVAQSSRPGWKSASKRSSASTAGSDADLLAGTGY